MPRETDDDALSWEGDDDPTLATSDAPAPPLRAALPDGFTAVGKGSDAIAAPAGSAAEATPEPEPLTGGVDAVGPRPLGNAALIALGVAGGVYALYVIGWVVGGLRLQGRAQYLIADVMFQGSFWLAVLAPVLWFATTLLLTGTAKPWVRFAWLIAGVVLLVPWPFVMIGTVGQ